MFIPAVLILLAAFSLFAVGYEMVTMRRWWPKETWHFPAITAVLLIVGLLSGAV